MVRHRWQTQADMVLLETKDLNDAIINLPMPLFVIKNDWITVETTETVKVNR